MKNSVIHLIALIVLVVFCATSCNDDTVKECDSLQNEMVLLKNKIDAFINSSICNDDTECKTMAFGSKPCGGPWSYLVYSTSIDEQELEQLVNQYNLLEAVYNDSCDAVSDCMFVSPPTVLACEDRKCVIIN